MTAIPRMLLRKHLELAHELQTAEAHADELRTKLQTIASAIRVLEPEWTPPKVGKKRLPVFKKRLALGDVSRLSARALAAGGSLTTAEIVSAIVADRALTFTDRRDRDDFASSVAMALRRFQRRGLVTAVPVAGTNKMRWSLRRG